MERHECAPHPVPIETFCNVSGSIQHSNLHLHLVSSKQLQLTGMGVKLKEGGINQGLSGTTSLHLQAEECTLLMWFGCSSQLCTGI